MGSSQQKSPHESRAFRQGLNLVTRPGISPCRRTNDAVCIFWYDYLVVKANSMSAREKENEWVNITLCRFLHNQGNIASEVSPRSQDYFLLFSANYAPLFSDKSTVDMHCTVRIVEQFGALCMHNPDDIRLSRC